MYTADMSLHTDAQRTVGHNSLSRKGRCRMVQPVTRRLHVQPLRTGQRDVHVSIFSPRRHRGRCYTEAQLPSRV